MDGSFTNSTTPQPDMGVVDDLVDGLIVVGVVSLIVFLLLGALIWFLWRRITCMRIRLTDLENALLEYKGESDTVRFRHAKGSDNVGFSSAEGSMGYESGEVSGREPSDAFQKTHVQIWGRKATIVGSPRILSQAYATTQDYFSMEGKLWKNMQLKVNTTNLIIRSKRFKNELPGGQLNNDLGDSGSRRPTSVINLPVDGAAESGASETVPYVSQKELFQRDTIGPEGGSIQVSGVTLKVPPGALETTVHLSIGVTWNTDKYPNLEKKQALLSPVVICEPQGTVFKQPVELSFPHCARDIMKDWVPIPMFSQTRINAASVWRKMNLEDYKERDLSNGRVRLKILHFTLYTLAGESREGKTAAKDIKILAFAPPVKVGKLHTVRIYCVENYKNEIEGIDNEEVRLGGQQVHPRLPLFLHDNGDNLHVANRDVSEGWKLDGKKLKELSFELIWHGKTPSCTFNFDALKRLPKFVAEFAAYQKGRETHCQELSIAQEAEEVQPDPWQVSTGVIPGELRRRLVVLLEPKLVSGNDWQLFAVKLGLDRAEISCLAERTSPVECLLNQWESQNSDLQLLRQLMVDMERHDAASEIAKCCNPSANNL